MKTLMTILTLAFTFAVVAPAISPLPLAAGQALAKHGADDPAGDDHGKHGAGHP